MYTWLWAFLHNTNECVHCFMFQFAVVFMFELILKRESSLTCHRGDRRNSVILARAAKSGNISVQS